MKIIRFGRASDNQVIINDPMVSAKHLAITQTNEGEFFVQDLGSSNGTLVNQTPIGKAPFLLQRGDVIKIGQTILAWEAYFTEELAPQAEPEISQKLIETEPTNPAQLIDNQLVDEENSKNNLPTKLKSEEANQTFDQQNNRILLWAVLVLLFLFLLFLLIWYARNVVKPTLNLSWLAPQLKFAAQLMTGLLPLS